jgi:cell shape-determining protein MreC
LRKEYEKKQKEAEELKKELDKPVDTTQYKYKKAVVMNNQTSNKATVTKKTVDQEEELLETPKLLLMQMVL